MKDKNYNCLRMYGYGQGMMMQSALLMDEMQDASRFLDMLVRHAYLPHLAGWGCPEGIIVHRSGKYYVAVNGYAGQETHVADSVKAVRLMLGVDDNDPAHLRFVPRFPADWTSMTIGDYPALTGEKRQTIGYTYAKNSGQHTFTFRLERPVAALSVRLGPIPRDRTIASVAFDGKVVPFEPIDSGDSRWVWVRGLSRASGAVVLKLDVK